MDRLKRIGRSCREFVRTLCKGAGAAAAAWLLAVALTSVATLLSEPPDSGTRDAGAKAAPAWGAEALNAAREQAFALAPVAIANACGIGASSCFKCHNGARAIAPKTDKKASPWHPDHRTVNDSCVGCHGGNARIIKKEIAHTDLVKDPRARAEACTHCHKSGNAPSLMSAYQAVPKGGK